VVSVITQAALGWPPYPHDTILVGFHGWPRTPEGLNQRCEMVDQTLKRIGCN